MAIDNKGNCGRMAIKILEKRSAPWMPRTMHESKEIKMVA